jgi:hypothetical protein
MALVAVAGLNVYQYLSHQLSAFVLEQQISRLDSEAIRLTRQVAARERDITELERQISDKSWELIELDQEILALSGRLEAARELAGIYQTNSRRYDLITGFLSRFSPGYASERFRASSSIVIMNMDSISRTFTITADLGEDTIVYMRTEGTDGTETVEAQWVDHWVDTTIGVRVTPIAHGATNIWFTNNHDWQTFQVLVIVTE